MEVAKGAIISKASGSTVIGKGQSLHLLIRKFYPHEFNLPSSDRFLNYTMNL